MNDSSLYRLLEETIDFCQDVLDRQKKGQGQVSFDIGRYIRHVDNCLYDEVMASDNRLKEMASLLFKRPEHGIQIVKKNMRISADCSEVTIAALGELKTFYPKRAWEGGIKEGMGIEFNNLLSDIPINYLCNDNMVITEKVFDPLYPEKMYLLSITDTYMYAYGLWEVYTSILHLTDRKITNVRWDGRRLANIDFGLVFYRGDLTIDSRLGQYSGEKDYKKGRLSALHGLLTKLRQNQSVLLELLVNIDSSFCNSLRCRSHPVAPVKILLQTLTRILDDSEHDLKGYVTDSGAVERIP